MDSFHNNRDRNRCSNLPQIANFVLEWITAFLRLQKKQKNSLSVWRRWAWARQSTCRADRTPKAEWTKMTSIPLLLFMSIEKSLWFASRVFQASHFTKNANCITYRPAIERFEIRGVYWTVYSSPLSAHYLFPAPAPIHSTSSPLRARPPSDDRASTHPQRIHYCQDYSVPFDCIPLAPDLKMEPYQKLQNIRYATFIQYQHRHSQR